MATDDRDPEPLSDPLVGVSSVREFVAIPPELLVVAVAILGYDLSIQLSMRFVSLHLMSLGASAVAVGAFGSAGMLAGLVVPYLAGEFPDDLNDTAVLLVLGSLSVAGLLLWLAAPELAATTGDLGPGWFWLLVGLALIHLWKLQGVAAEFDTGRRRLPYEPLVTGLESDESVRRLLVVFGVVPVVALFVFLPFVPGFHVLVALGAALGFTAVLAQVTVVDRDPTGTDGRDPSTLDTLRGELASVPDSLEPLLVGDLLAQFAVGMIHLFLVMYVVTVLGLDATVFGVYFSPPSVFALLIGVEAATALAGVVPGEELVREFGVRAVLRYALVATAAFPLLLLVSPGVADALHLPHLAVIVGLFALYGTRFFALPARNALFDGISGVAGTNAGDAYRTVRNTAVVPSALVGGALYAVSPNALLIGAGAAAALGAFAFHRVDDLPDHADPFTHAR
ncbi:hypothetical protein [Halocalculus aciditolerans]|uniref:MFS transporter n=1 Tax=Halocalculus aciditolerans TaxID=1383812 RepID=A0A830FJA7_9EURY|nr:hypothetical protein [Halocalculus aciditolerans]GGL61686.1 hypothetical protein GCM10009039_19870 [Halocalculus aciditolerans]